MNLIKDTNTLKKTIDVLSQSDFVTVDTEFLRESTFWPELCLVQIASPQTAVIIDPLAQGIDLGPFFELMADRKILKVFHAARQDIEIIFHLAQVIPEPLFDTQIAAMVCGYGEAVSYDMLVSGISGYHIDKSSRFTDWKKRPLTPKQLDYALSDVTHLCDIYISLRNQLQTSGRSDWLHDEMNILISPETYTYPPENAWKRIKGRIRKPRELAVLQKIAAWREERAQKQNQPRGHILKDNTLIEIAIQQPKSRKALTDLRSFPRNYRTERVDELVMAVAEGLSVPDDSLPELNIGQQNHDVNKSETEILRLLLKLVTEENNVAAKLVATSDDLTKIVLWRDRAKVPAMRGWRFDIFGRKALSMLSGQIGIKFESGTIKLFDIS